VVVREAVAVGAEFCLVPRRNECLFLSSLVYATSRKVAGSVSDDVIGIFQLHNPSGRTVALGSTKPLAGMSTRNDSWGE
jgi:hypothetical protein